MRFLVALLVATAATVLCGCSVMESSALLAPSASERSLGEVGGGDIVRTRHEGSDEPAAQVDDVGCRGKLGAYYLTKRLVKLKLVKTGSVYTLSSGSELGSADPGLVTVPDRQRGYCLEFLESQTSQDKIMVERDPEGFLKAISSENLDKSADIAKTVIKTIFTAITGNPNFDDNLAPSGDPREREAEAKPAILLEATYDPTEPVETALINTRLAESGFCLILEGQLPVLIEDRAAYCDDPMGYLKKKSPRGARTLVKEHEKLASGIYYRPRRPYAYSVLINSGKTCVPSPVKKCTKTDWTLREEKTIELENLSPIIAIRVDRTFFATRKTTITFLDGVLYDVKIRKDSELAGFVEIPLQIAKGIVAIPGNMVSVRLDNTSSRKRLVEAQTLLLSKQQEHFTALEKAGRK